MYAACMVPGALIALCRYTLGRKLLSTLNDLLQFWFKPDGQDSMRAIVQHRANKYLRVCVLKIRVPVLKTIIERFCMYSYVFSYAAGARFLVGCFTGV